MRKALCIVLLVMILIFVTIVLSGTLCAQDLRQVTIDDTSPGLITSYSPYKLPWGAARVHHNLDPTRSFGDIVKRYGYIKMFTLPGLDSLLWGGIFAASYLDGNKQLFLVGDSDGVGYANIYGSDMNTLKFGAVDTFFWTPDTAQINYYLDSLWYVDSLVVGLQVISGADTFRDSIIQSAKLNPSDINDSLIAGLNSIAGSYLTVSYDTDTLIIAEDSDRTTHITHISRYCFNDVCAFDIVSLIGSYDNDFFDEVRTSGSLDAGKRVFTKFPATGHVKMAQYRNRIYAVNGVGRAVSFDDRNWSWFPARAPGELIVLPYDTTGNMDGRYRYAVKYASYEDSTDDSIITNQLGYLSQPVIVDSGMVQLSGFPPRPADLYHGADSMTVEIWRMAGNVGRLDKQDTIWKVDEVMVDSTNYQTLTYMDTMSDVTLRAQSEKQIYVDGEFYEWKDSTASDGTDHTIRHKPGAPALLAWEVRGGADDSGIWGGASLDWTNCAGYSWFFLGVDTNTYSISDSGSSYNVYQDSGVAWADTSNGLCRAVTEQVSFRVPRTSDSNIVYFLYRGPIIPINIDSGLGAANYPIVSGHLAILKRMRHWGEEFEVPFYFYVGQYNQGDSAVDSLPYINDDSAAHSLVGNEVFRRNAVPAPAMDIASFNNRLIVTDGRNVYVNEAVDTAVLFNVLKAYPINNEGGDHVTTLWEQTGVVKIAQFNSVYNFYRRNGIWQDIELADHYGCVAAFSHASAPEGDYFLSRDGIRLEDEALYKERSFVGNLMSNNIKSLRTMPLTTLTKSYGVYHNNKYILSFPALDTSFVIFKIPDLNGKYRYPMGTWDLTMTGATYYRPTVNYRPVPGDSLYFIKSGEASVYLFGASEYDHHTTIDWEWRSAYLWPLSDSLWSIDAAQLTVESPDTANNLIGGYFYDERDTTLAANNILLSRMDTTRFHSFGFAASDLGLSWSVGLRSTTGADSYEVGETVISRLRLNFKYRGLYPQQ